MKSTELRKLTKDELVQKSNEIVAELQKVRLSINGGEINGENIKKVRELKKDLARTKTVLNELRIVKQG